MPLRRNHMHRIRRYVENFGDRGGERLATWRLSRGTCTKCLGRCPRSGVRGGRSVSHIRSTREAEAGDPWAAAVDCWVTPEPRQRDAVAARRLAVEPSRATPNGQANAARQRASTPTDETATDDARLDASHRPSSTVAGRRLTGASGARAALRDLRTGSRIPLTSGPDRDTGEGRRPTLNAVHFPVMPMRATVSTVATVVRSMATESYPHPSPKTSGQSSLICGATPFTGCAMPMSGGARPCRGRQRQESRCARRRGRWPPYATREHLPLERFPRRPRDGPRRLQSFVTP